MRVPRKRNLLAVIEKASRPQTPLPATPLSGGPAGPEGPPGPEGPQGKEGPAGSATMAGFKEPCRVATTVNVTIATALNSGDAVDGVTLANGDRVLVANQTTASQNGIYVVSASPARSTDADAAGELNGGTQVYIQEGTVYGDRVMRITTNGSITPGTTAHTWAPLHPRSVAYGRVSSAGAAVSGEGFTVAKTGTGAYKITFTTEAAIIPTVLVTPETSAIIPVWAAKNHAKGSVEVAIWNFGGGVANDCAFSFEAKG